MRFQMFSIRTNDQGRKINIGKDVPEYQAIVDVLSMNPEDMKTLGVTSGARVRVWNSAGETTFECKEGKVPAGLIFVPYGPPTCKLYVCDTDGTGMPTTKGWDVEVEAVK